MDIWILPFEEFGGPLRTPVPIRCKLKILQSLGHAPSSTFSFFVALRSLNLVTQLIFFLIHLLEKLNVFVTKHFELFPLNQVFAAFLDL